jgi:glucokinase
VSEGEILGLSTIPTMRERTPEDILGRIVELIAEVTMHPDLCKAQVGDPSRNRSVSGIGIGVPCPAGPGTDRLGMIENIPSMEGYSFRPLVEERCEVPVVLENDANCMAFGEQRAGALRGCSHCVCLTLGTGLGCGIIISGKLYRGAGNYAGEIWNIPFTPRVHAQAPRHAGTPWRNGRILEDEVSIGGLRTMYRDMAGVEIDPREMYDRFCDGDSTAAAVFDRFGEALGQIAVMLISTLDPERIALGGGLSMAYDAFKDGMLRTVEKTWGAEGGRRIVPAELSGRAAVIGAAALAEEYIGRWERGVPDL